MGRGDDYDRLGQAVARVLRETFAATAEGRAMQAATVNDELDGALASIRALPETFAAHHAEQTAELAATLDEAKRSVADMLAAATEEASAIRVKAMEDAKTIVEGADAEIQRAREAVAEERVKLDGELKDLVRDVRRAVNSLETAARLDHEALLDRATSEARMILRQARLHHRSTAREVDRMIEAAAEEAAALRKSALADAARVAARVRGVVDYPSERDDERDEPRPPAWVRPSSPSTAPAEQPTSSSFVAGEAPVAAPGETATPHRRRLRPAS
jgi:F0F1-type ATP synthase membrane subunit b/b'